MRFLLFLFVLTMGINSTSLRAATCKIEAKAVVGFLNFDIEGCKIDGALTKTGDVFMGTFSADLKLLDSNNDERNDHMLNKYLEVSKYPVIVVKLLPVRIGDKAFKAEVSLHGETHEIYGNLDFPAEGKFKAEFMLDIVKFGIEKPGYGNIVIGQNIAVTVTL